MRIGSVSHSSHAAGMSALWHDPEFDAPVRRFETPLVQKSFEDLPVPTEHHELPDGVSDPFKKLDAVYDAAAVQMERGIKGSDFLHGKNKAPDANFGKPDDVTRMSQERPVALDPSKQTQQKMDQQERNHFRNLDQAANAAPATTSNGSKTAAAKEAEKAANAGGASSGLGGESVVNAAMTFAPMAAAQAATTLAQGPLPAMAAQAINTTGAVASVAELGMVGVAEATKETAEASRTSSRPTLDDTEGSSSRTPRRGLAKKS